MEQHILYKDKKVHYQSQGKGKTVVLLHGFTESMQIWNTFSAELAREFHVICIDLPGHGKTEVFHDTHSMEFMADVVKAVLDHLNISTCVMIGHSMGGYVTLAFAKKYPELVKGFGLFHSHAGADSEEAKANRIRTIKIVESNRTGFIQNFIPDLFAPENRIRFSAEIDLLKQDALRSPAEGITAALRGMMEREDNTYLLETTKKPMLFIAGKEDARIPVETVMKQASLASHAEILILGGTGHMGFIEAPGETLQSIRYFVRKVFSSGPKCGHML